MLSLGFTFHRSIKLQVNWKPGKEGISELGEIILLFWLLKWKGKCCQRKEEEFFCKFLGKSSSLENLSLERELEVLLQPALLPHSCPMLSLIMHANDKRDKPERLGNTPGGHWHKWSTAWTFLWCLSAKKERSYWRRVPCAFLSGSVRAQQQCGLNKSAQKNDRPPLLGGTKLNRPVRSQVLKFILQRVKYLQSPKEHPTPSLPSLHLSFPQNQNPRA